MENNEINTLTLAEALKKARAGAKITHRYFDTHEYMMVRGVRVTFEDGVRMYLDEFLADRNSTDWQTDWEVYKEKKIIDSPQN